MFGLLALSHIGPVRHWAPWPVTGTDFRQNTGPVTRDYRIDQNGTVCRASHM